MRTFKQRLQFRLVAPQYLRKPVFYAIPASHAKTAKQKTANRPLGRLAKSLKTNRHFAFWNLSS